MFSFRLVCRRAVDRCKVFRDGARGPMLDLRIQRPSEDNMHLRALVIGLIGLFALGGVSLAADSKQCQQKCKNWPSPMCQNIDFCISSCNVAPHQRQNCVAAEQQLRGVQEREQRLEAKEARMGCNQRCRSWPNPTCQNLDFCISQCRSNPHDRQSCEKYFKSHR